LSTRIDRGRPHRWKIRRNKARASFGGIVCHCAWGGKLARQERSRIHVDGGHPADLRAGLEPLLLDGVHLPDVVGCFGLGPDHPRALGSSGPVDPLPLEGTLECARRGDKRGIEEAEQLDADPPAPPGWVLPLELTGSSQDGAGVPRGGAAALVVADGQAVLAPTAESTPEGADSDERQVEVGGDLCEGVAVEVAAGDLLTGGEWDGARHGRSSGFIEGEYP
jgi:hypothetical protein